MHLVPEEALVLVSFWVVPAQDGGDEPLLLAPHLVEAAAPDGNGGHAVVQGVVLELTLRRVPVYP